MIIILGIASIFLFVSIFMFYRAESLSRELSITKRDLSAATKEKEFLFDLISAKVNYHQGFLVKRYDNIAASYKKKGQGNPLDPLHPIVTNYATIFHECARKPKNVKGVIKGACEQAEKGSFRKFEHLLQGQDKQIKTLWNQGKVTTFSSLVEALLLQQEQSLNGMVVEQEEPAKASNGDT